MLQPISVSSFQALQNPLILFSHAGQTDCIDWDVDRFVDKAKVNNPAQGGQAQRDMLARYFQEHLLGHILEPATIVDRNGKILAWHLPNILTADRVVGSQHFPFNLYSYQDN